MSKQWKPGKQTVELGQSRIRREPGQPSRIRREPVPEPRGLAKIDWSSREWEIRLAVTGVILFALALAALWVGVSEVTSH